jgi:AcrR family transcriptional regulator
MVQRGSHVTVERLTRERRRELTREALLAAARHVFAQRGFTGASLEEIAETAGFTRGAIYKNFANKEELFFQVFERGIERQLDAFTDAFAPSPMLDDVAKAADTWRNVLAHDEEWLAFNLEFRLYALRNPTVRPRFAEEQRRTRTMIARYIEAQTENFGLALKLPAETLAAILDATSIGFLEDALITNDDAQPYEAFLRLIVPSIVDLPTDVAATSSSSPE